MIRSRRTLLGQLAAGGVIATMPAFLAGCGVAPATTVADPAPANPFLDWFGLDEATLLQVMAELGRNGADLADIYLQHRRSGTVTLRDGEFAQSGIELLQGAGLRVSQGGQTGYAFTEELTPEAMRDAARKAATIARGVAVPNPESLLLVPPGNLYPVVLPWYDVDRGRKRQILESADSAARSADESVSGITVSLSDEDERVLIMTDDGRMVVDQRPMTRLSVQVTATRGGTTESGFASIAGRAGEDWYTTQRIAGVAQLAVARTMILFESRRAPRGELPVVLSAGSGAVLVHEAIGHSFEADLVRNGISPLSGRKGDSVAASIVNIVDQGNLPGHRGALNVDDEGNDGRRNLLVENGILRSYLHDSHSARLDGVPVTGTGRRESYRHEPLPRMTCTYIDDGPHDRQEIIAAVDFGIVADTFTDGQVRLGEGDFRFNVRSGWLIEKGKLSVPLKDIVVLGNGPAMLANITMLGNDSVFDQGGWSCGKNGQLVPVSQGMPTALVSALGVAPRAA